MSSNQDNKVVAKADEIKALVERLRDGTNTSWEQTFLDCHEAADALEALSYQLTAKTALANLYAASLRQSEAEVEGLKAENQRLRLEFRADCEKQARELFAVQRDAARWRAFINCARIRLFGWAGYGSTKGGQDREPDSNGYRHFGGEFWTIYSAPSDPMAQEILTGFADAAVAIDARSQSEEEKT